MFRLRSLACSFAISIVIGMRSVPSTWNPLFARKQAPGPVPHPYSSTTGCGNEKCRNLLDEEPSNCCSCQNLDSEKMCSECFVDYCEDESRQTEYAMMKAQGINECEICDAPTRGKRCPAHMS